MTSMRRPFARFLVVGVAAAVALAACGGGSSKGASNTTGGGGTKSNLPSCPVHALDTAKGPVSITMWHSMTRANEDTLKKLTNQFNASQTKVHVNLVNQTSYTDTLTKFTAGLSNHQLPDVVQGEEIALQELIDTQAILPVQSCVDAEKYDTSDFVARAIKYFTVNNVLYAMPFNVSNPVLYYDKTAFTAAGLDPNKPPTTLDELKRDSQIIVSKNVRKYGIALHTDGWFIEQWLAKAGVPFVNNGNGRVKRATAVTFGGAEGLNLFTWLSDMVKSGLAVSTGSGPSSIDHYLDVGNQVAAMTIDTSAALGTISLVLGQGQFAKVQLAVGPMPGPQGNGGVLIGGGALYISKSSSPEKQAAAWEFLKFLDTAQSQSTWSAGTGYVPIRKSATTLAPLSTLWQQKPYYRVAYDQLLGGAVNDATAGPVIGPYGAKGVGVRGAVIDALDAMLTQKVPPPTALQDAVTNSNKALTSYNQRIGG
ncbi:MAG: ABC-type sugar transport system, periplasmic component [Actinomycetia bacterium]|nr:ABC-type sugar transport system, periplasmic component [Actinomycetes bacterium]